MQNLICRTAYGCQMWAMSHAKFTFTIRMSRLCHRVLDGAIFWISFHRLKLLRKASCWELIQNLASYTIVWRRCTLNKKSKNLKNGHFLQSRTKIVLIEIKFTKFWHIGGWCASVCLINTLNKLVFYSKISIKNVLNM